MLNLANIKSLTLHTDPDLTNCKLEFNLYKRIMYKGFNQDTIFFKCSFDVGAEKLKKFSEYKKNLKT